MADITPKALQQEIAHLRAQLAQSEADRSNLGSLLESIGDIFFSLDLQGRFTYLNEAAEKHFQTPRSQLLGYSMWELWPEQISGICHVEFERALNERTNVSFELFVPPSDTWLGVRAYYHANGLSVHAQDITAPKKANEALLVSETNYRRLLDTASEGIWIVDPQGITQYINQRLADMLGYSSDELIGKSAQMFLPTDSLSPTLSKALERVRNGESGQTDAQLMRRNGSQLWTITSFAPILDSEGRLISILGMLTDITERKIAEERLRVSEQEALRLADAMSLIVWTSKRGGPAYYYNQHFYNYTGLSQEEAIGLGWRLLVHPDDLEECIRLSAIAAANNSPLEVKYRLRRFDGVYRWHLGRARPLFDDDAQVLFWVGTATDIDDERRLQEAQAELYATQDQFLSIVSHDLRSPLTSIKGYTQLLQRNIEKIKANPDAAIAKPIANSERMLGTIDHQTERMQELINQLLDLTRLGQKRLELNYSSQVNLLDVIERVVEQQNAAHPQRRVSWRPDALKEIRLDFDIARIEQVLDNLIGNALKYSPDSTPVTIGLAESTNTDEVTVYVKDEGIGISPENQLHLFERYFRVQDASSRNVEGLGLGLYISYGLIVQHGGRMWIESAIGQGSTFYFSLPLSMPNQS